MLPGGGAICAKVSFTSREDRSAPRLAHQRPARLASLVHLRILFRLGGYSWLSIDQWFVAGVACVMKEGNALIPIATDKSRIVFFSSRYHHC